VIAEALSCDAAIWALPAMDTVKEVKASKSAKPDVALITATIRRERRFVLAQTPTGLSRIAAARSICQGAPG